MSTQEILKKDLPNGNNPQLNEVYSIVKKLLGYKGTQQSALLLLLLTLEGKLGSKVTKKTCQQLLNTNPNSALKYLTTILDLTTGTIVDDFTSFNIQDEEIDDSPDYKFSWKYGKQFHSSFNSFGKLLQKVAFEKRYTTEEYFNLLIAQVRKDDWWKKVVTEEMVLRKFEFLNNKFGSSIVKKVGGLDTITHIF